MKIRRSKINASEDFEKYEDEIEEIGQENTSINSGKLPAVFNMVSFEPGSVNIDYGGGRFDNVADYLSQYDVINLVYDPYNRTQEHNKEVIKTVRAHGGADTATCSNVLNVIKEPEVRLNVLKNIKKLVKPTGTVYITVYEGSGKGDSKPTKSGYQLNKKTADYLEEIQQVFPDATRKGKLITCHPQGGVESSTSITAGPNSLKDEIYRTAKQVMMSDSFGFPEEEVDEYMVVEVKPAANSTQVEVRAEVSYEGLERMCDALNPIVQKYDAESYFEPVEPGIIDAYVRNVNSATNTSNINAGWYDVPERPLDPPDPKEYDQEDDVDDYIELSVDDIIVVDEDGSWDFEDDSFPWCKGDNKYGDFLCYEYSSVTLDDESGVIEKVYDLLDSYIPGDSGRYRIKCDVTLSYLVTGIESEITDYWEDEVHGSDYNKEVYTDNAEAEYRPKKSSVSNFTWVES